MKTHICLVSDQTIPNILGIYHFKPDRVIFVQLIEWSRKAGQMPLLIH